MACIECFEFKFWVWVCCWCSVLGDLVILADSLSIGLGIGLSIIYKAEELMLRWLWGAISQWSEHLQLKQEALGSILGG